MNTRTTNRRPPRSPCSIVGALALTWPLVVSSATAFGAARKDGPATKSAGRQEDGEDDGAEKTLPPILQQALEEKEVQVTEARREAIKLLEAYLRENPSGSAGFRAKEQAEALYKLAELYWEESKEVYLEKMGRYQAAVSACHADRSECPKVPHRPPTDRSVAGAGGLPAAHRQVPQVPQDRHGHLPLRLLAARPGQKIGESIKYFQIILDKYPRSRYIADAWMAIAEYRFYEQQDYKSSLEAYEKVLKHPKSTLYDLALFKTAWCYWKLGDTTKSAQRFKDVLDLAKKKAGRTEAEQKRAEELQGEALDYLVELFTEDDTKTARDAFEFLAQIGGKQYSRKVLKQLADTVFDQTRYERAVEAYRLLIELDPNAADAPDYAGKIVEGYQLLGDIKTAVAEMRKLASDYGGRSAWATANQRPPQDRRARAHDGRGAHPRPGQDDARRGAGRTRRPPRSSTRIATRAPPRPTSSTWPTSPTRPTPPSCATCAPTSSTSSSASTRTPGASTWPSARPSRSASTTRTRCSRRWARSRRCASRSAGSARGKREITDSDRQFGEAADLYATLFPNDKEIVTVIYKNGQFFFDYGDYDEAIKRFGLIVERYPDDPNAGAAGDRILQALNKAKDYENIESWARRLKKTKAFASKDEQERLDKLIVGAVMKSGEKYAASGKYDKAAAFFLRVPKEYPSDGNAPKALNNAAVVYEKAKKQDEAVAAYKQLADKYPAASEAPEALFTAARIEENIAYYDKAAGLYEQLAAKYPQNAHAADALRSAGVLRQSLGQHDRAIKHYGEYAKRYKDRPDAKDVAFQAAVVREDQKDWRGAAAVVRRLQQGLSGRRQDRRGAGARGRRAPQVRQRRRRQGDRRQGARRLQASTARGATRGAATTPPRRATSRASSPTSSTRRSRSPASRSSSPRCSRRRPSGSRRRRRSTSTSSPTSRPSGRRRRSCASARATRRSPRRCATRPCRRTSRKTRSRCTATSWRRSSSSSRTRRSTPTSRATRARCRSASTTSTPRRSAQALGRLAENEYPKEAELRLSTRPGEPRVTMDRIEEVRRDQ